MSRRFFAFGCSFTNYRWLTWADILGRQYDHYYNWGQAGAGNKYIHNAVMEADQRQKFQPGDTVIVCWTNITREDRYINGRGWVTLGNVTSSPIFTKEFIADAVCERGYLIESLGFIKSVRDFLNYKNVNWQFLSMLPIIQPNNMDDRILHYGDVTDLYRDVLDSIKPSFIDILGQSFWKHNKEKRFKYDNGGVDYHPTSEEHLLYLDNVLPGWVDSSNSVRGEIAQTPIIMSSMTNGSCKQKRL